MYTHKHTYMHYFIGCRRAMQWLCYNYNVSGELYFETAYVFEGHDPSFSYICLKLKSCVEVLVIECFVCIVV